VKKRILVLCHQSLVPPENVNTKDENFQFSDWITEYDVITTLKKLKHEVRVLGVFSDLLPIRQTIEEFRPHIIFNLLEEFDGEVLYDQNVVSYLELLRVKYTGADPRSLMISRDKSLAKKLMSYHRIPTPKFQVFGKSKKKKLNSKLAFPLIVKCLYEEASLGISNASVVNSEEKLYERVAYLIDKYDTEVIVEEFIEGREFYVGIMGNNRLKTLPVWELKFDNVDKPDKELYSQRAKWNKKYRERKGINSGVADIDKDLEKEITRISKKTYKALELTGYARIDLRVTADNRIYVLEANPNPNIAQADEFALSAKSAGMSYKKLINKILSFA
jgi:D-alanine-D-alanine ligase